MVPKQLFVREVVLPMPDTILITGNGHSSAALGKSNSVETVPLDVNPDSGSEPEMEPAMDGELSESTRHVLDDMLQAACGTAYLNAEGLKLAGDGLRMHQELQAVGQAVTQEPVLVPSVPDELLKRVGIRTATRHHALGALSGSRLTPIPNEWPTVFFHKDTLQVYENPVDVPYRLALVCLLENTNHGSAVLGQRLLPFRKGQKQGRPYLHTELRLADVVPLAQAHATNVSVWVIPVDPENKETRDWIPRSDLQRLLNDPGVAADADLRSRISELVQRFGDVVETLAS